VAISSANPVEASLFHAPISVFPFLLAVNVEDCNASGDGTAFLDNEGLASRRDEWRNYRFLKISVSRQ